MLTRYSIERQVYRTHIKKYKFTQISSTSVICPPTIFLITRTYFTRLMYINHIKNEKEQQKLERALQSSTNKQ